MGSGHAPPLDDNDHRRGDPHGSRLEDKRSVICLGMPGGCGKLFIVRMAQRGHMVTNNEDELVVQSGKRTTLQPTAGTAQQTQWLFCRTLVSVFGPFKGSQADRPA